MHKQIYSSNNTNTQEKFSNNKNTIPDQFKGGRSLTAIWKTENKELKGIDILILSYFGSFCDLGVGGNFQEWKYHAKDDMVKELHCNMRTIRKHIKSLIDKGYISERTRKKNGTVDLASEYKLTNKIFDEYLVYLATPKKKQPIVTKETNPKIPEETNPKIPENTNLQDIEMLEEPSDLWVEFTNALLHQLGGALLHQLGGAEVHYKHNALNHNSTSIINFTDNFGDLEEYKGTSPLEPLKNEISDSSIQEKNKSLKKTKTEIRSEIREAKNIGIYLMPNEIGNGSNRPTFISNKYKEVIFYDLYDKYGIQTLRNLKRYCINNKVLDFPHTFYDIETAIIRLKNSNWDIPQKTEAEKSEENTNRFLDSMLDKPLPGTI